MDILLHKEYQEIEKTHWWFFGRRKLIENFLKEYVPVGGKILDFGCNNGFFVDILQKSGYEVIGVDVSEEAIEFGVSRGVKKLYHISSAQPLPFPPSSFDAILALDVLEHIEDDHLALVELKRVLKSGGKLIATVPAFPFMWGVQDEVAHHFRRYTKKTAMTLFGKAGLDIVRFTFFNFFLFLPAALIRIFAKFFPPKRKSDFELNNSLTNFLLTKIFVFEVGLIKFINFPFGISLLMVSVKK